ncbi:hypothetical protein F5X99DRAFT_387757 [Biscogniauxia marginata]|nr:hypothetical protein F5X99DRAFT_387757 [Biscogniauxia marginata]
MADSSAPKTSYSTDPALYIYTSLTAGSSHIVTATSRLETILRANRVPFKALDIAVDEKARMLWGRRAGKDANGRVRKLPALVQMGLVLGDIVEIEEWNEYGELKQNVKIYYDDFTIPPKSQAPPPVAAPKTNKPANPSSASKTPPTTTAAAPPPAAPPLPATTNKTDAAKKSSTAPKKAADTAKPVSSVAEEAAAKAKQVRLDALRAKVHGSKKENKDPNKKKDSGESTPAAAAAATPSNKSGDASSDLSEGVAKLSIAGETAAASPGKIAAAEKASAIPEEESSDEDDESEEEEESEDNDDDDKGKKK